MSADDGWRENAYSLHSFSAFWHARFTETGALVYAATRSAIVAPCGRPSRSMHSSSHQSIVPLVLGLPPQHGMRGQLGLSSNSSSRQNKDQFDKTLCRRCEIAHTFPSVSIVLSLFGLIRHTSRSVRSDIRGGCTHKQLRVQVWGVSMCNVEVRKCGSVCSLPHCHTAALPEMWK